MEDGSIEDQKIVPSEGESNVDTSGDISVSLDFFSNDFNALRALQIEQLNPPVPNVQPLESVNACQRILPQEADCTIAAREHLSQHESIEEEGQKDSLDPKPSSSTDFFSPNFDALKALQTEDLLPPNPRVRPLDNLNKCRRILPQEVPESLINEPTKLSRSSESIIAQERAKARASLVVQKAAERARQVKIFDVIAEKLKNGPLSILVECYQERKRVQVWTRHAHGVRGVLTGSLIALDKHINMVLKDVDEEYSVRRWVPRLVNRCKRSSDAQETKAAIEEDHVEASNKATKAVGLNDGVEELSKKLQELRLFPKLEHRKRHLKQVFLRGDSIVMVRKIP